MPKAPQDPGQGTLPSVLSLDASSQCEDLEANLPKEKQSSYNLQGCLCPRTPELHTLLLYPAVLHLLPDSSSSQKDMARRSCDPGGSLSCQAEKENKLPQAYLTLPLLLCVFSPKPHTLGLQTRLPSNFLSLF